MKNTRPINSRYQVGRKVIIYDTRRSTPLGRVLAFVFGILLLIAAFFFSLVFFAILLTAALFFLAYAGWLSKRIGSQKGRTIEVEYNEQRNESTPPTHSEDQRQ